MASKARRAVMGEFLTMTIMFYVGCTLPPPGTKCGEMWCPEEMICVEVAQDIGMQHQRCAAQNTCGNGIIDPGEKCDCGDEGIVAPGALCAGRGNSSTSGLCR